MTYASIFGTGAYLPEKILTNKALEEIVDTTDEWIVERTGIFERRMAAAEETTTSMAEAAARQALDAANISSNDLDMIIVATTMPEYIFPSTACLLQHRLGIKRCAAFDLNSSACAGFIYALSIADQYIRTHQVRYALVIGSEIMTRMVDWKDRATCVLFGDGAGAVVLGSSDRPGILSTHIHANGDYKDVLYLKANYGDSSYQVKQYVKMVGHQLFKLAVTILGDLFDETLAANALVQSDVDWLIPHQANMRIIHSMAKKLHLPLDRVAITLDKQGNTSSASIPLSLDQAVRRGQVKKGQLLLMEGFGGGLVWGSALIRF